MIEKIWNKKIKGITGLLVLILNISIEKLINKILTTLFTSNIKYSGKNVNVMKGLIYRYPCFIEIHDNVIIGKRTSLISEGLDKHYLIIENGVSIGSNCDIDFSGGVLIRKEAHVAHHVLISTHDHGYDYQSKPIGKPLEIGENAFIGSKSIIMHNCNYIGKHAVVGTGSVVTKDVPDYAIVAGNPARVIKYLNNERKG